MKRSVKMFSIASSILSLFCFLLNPVIALADPDCSAGKSLSIVAHTDDDLLFINPKIQQDISAGKCTETVYLTASDSGAGLSHAQGRENGVRAAYAQMAGATNSWTTTNVTVNGRSLLQSTLTANAKVRLLFLRLPDGNLDGNGFSPAYESLPRLWYGNVSSISAIDSTANYTKQQLIDTLHSLMAVYAPNIIRTLNYQDAYETSSGPTHDHPDHRIAGYFTKEAHMYYTVPHQLRSYRGYDIQTSPANVSSADLSNKQDAFFEYNRVGDGGGCQSASVCDTSEYLDYLQRNYEVKSQDRSTQSFDTLDGSSIAASGTTSDTGKAPVVKVFGSNMYTFYYEATTSSTGKLRYAKATSSAIPAWSFYTLDTSSANIGQNPSAEVFNGRLYVFYYDATNGDLREADTADGANWTFNTIDSSGTTGQTPYAVINGGLLRAYYYDQTNGDLKQAWLDSGAWYHATIEGNTSAVINDNNYNVGQSPVALTYTDPINNTQSLQIFSYNVTLGDLEHTWNDANGVWRHESLDGNSTSNGKVTTDVGYNPTAVTYDGTIQLYYYDNDNGNGNLRHAWHDPNTGWHFEILDGDGYAVTRHDADVGQTPNVTVQDDMLHVFAKDSTNNDIRHYWSSPTQNWQSEVLDGSGDDGASGRTNDNTGDDPSATVYDTKLHVFYYESSDTNLRHATL